MVCKVQRKVLLRSSCVFCESRRKKSGGVGDDHGLLRQELLHLGVEGDLLLCVFSHGLDDKVCILKCLCHVKLELDLLVCGLDLLQAFLLVE